jgi:WD40 repeat protein
MDYNFFHILPRQHTLSGMIKSLFNDPIIQKGNLSKPVTNSQLMMKTSESLHIGKTVRMTMAAFCLSSLVTSAAAQGGDNIISFFHDATKVRSLGFSGNGKFLIAKSGEEVIVNPKGMTVSPSIHVWELETKRKARTFAERELGRASCVSWDGNLLAFREANNINIMDLNTQKVINTIRFSENRNSFAKPVAFTSENKSLIVEQGNVCTSYTVGTGQYEREFSSNGLSRYFSPDDAYFIEGFVDSVRLVDFQKNKELAIFRCGQGAKPEELKSVYFSPENKFFATHSDNKVRLWETVTPALIQPKYMPAMFIGVKDNFFGFSTDGRYFVGGNDTVKLWDLTNRKEIITPLSFESKISAAAFSPDGKYLAAGDSKGNIKVWNFTDETISSVYYQKEIQTEYNLIRPRGEFEREIEWVKRVQKSKRAINNKYLGLYSEKVTTDKSPQDRFLEEWDQIRNAQETLRITSRKQILFKIDSISMYNADKETFGIRVVSEDKAYKYSRTEVIKFPRRDGASCFKQNYQTIKVEGTTQLAENMKDWDIFNIKIKCNCTGKDKDYPFGLQRQNE